MFKILAKLFVWCAIGCVAVGVVVDRKIFSTPFKYTIHSIVAPGTQVTITQPNGEPLHAEVTETTAHKHTVDVGAPASLIGMYLLGSIMVYGLKGRRRRFVEPC